MTILFILGFCIILILALTGCLKLKNWSNRGRMIDANWLDSSERFKLITRWGA